MRSSGTAGGADETDLLTALDQCPLDDLGAVEVEVERVEPEPVIENHEAAGEEKVIHQGHSTAIRREHRGAPLGSEVGARMGHPRLAVDDPARAEPGAGEITSQRPDE